MEAAAPTFTFLVLASRGSGFLATKARRISGEIFEVFEQRGCVHPLVDRKQVLKLWQPQCGYSKAGCCPRGFIRSFEAHRKLGASGCPKKQYRNHWLSKRHDKLSCC